MPVLDWTSEETSKECPPNHWQAGLAQLHDERRFTLKLRP